MRKPPRDGVTEPALAAAAAAPVVRLDDSAGEHGPLRFEALASHDEAKLVEAAEPGQVRARESKVRQVEVFRNGSVRTSIFGRPRALSGDRRAPIHTVNWDEPSIVGP